MPRQVLHKRHTGTTTTVADTGNPVTNGTNLQTAINAAVAGDTIVLTAGVEYRGNFTLPNKSGASYITITSSAASSLTAGVRVTSASAGNMAKLTTATSFPVFGFAKLSHHWALVGLEITATTTQTTSRVRVPSLVASSYDLDTAAYGEWAHHLTVDRCYIHALEEDPLPYRAAERGIAIDGADITITNCWVGNFMGWEMNNAYFADWSQAQATLAGATNATPCRVTLTTALSDPTHKFLVTFAGATGGWAGLNGTKVATWIDSTHLDLQTPDMLAMTTANTDSSSWGSFSGQTVTLRAQNIQNAVAVTAVAGPGPYVIVNNFLEGYYNCIFTGGGGTWLPPANYTTVTAVSGLDQATLAGLGNLQVGDLIAFWTMEDQTISGATAGSPTILTVQTHRFPVGTRLYPEGGLTIPQTTGGMIISGFTGAWAACNGEFRGTVVDSTHISIAVDSTAFGAVTGSGMKWIATVKGTYQAHVGKVTNIAGNVVTHDWWGHQPDNTNGNGTGLKVANGSAAQFNGLSITGMTVRHNTLSQRKHWIWLIREIGGTEVNKGSGTKGLWESKHCVNVLVEGNVFQIVGAGEPGTDGPGCFGINQANQGGATPWVQNSHWTIRNNVFRHCGFHKISLVEEYETGLLSTDFTYHNNVHTKVNAAFISLEGTDHITITKNTARNMGGAGGSGTRSWIMAYQLNNSVLIRDNVGLGQYYGMPLITPESTLVGTVDHNLASDDYGSDNWSFVNAAGNIIVAGEAAIKFVSSASEDYHGLALAADSPGHHAASDSTDCGVDFAALDAALVGNDDPDL